MNRMPNEIRFEIVRQLRDEADRKALVAAYPTWSEVVEREDKLRVATIDESRRHGVSTEDFLAAFEGTGLRRRQFLEEIKVDRFVDAAAYYEACCPITAERYLTSEPLADFMQRLMEGIDRITEKSVNAGLKAPAITLSLRACVNDLESWQTCSDNHTDEEVQRSLVSTRNLLFQPHNTRDPSKFKGVNEFRFENQCLFQHVNLKALMSMMGNLVGLRVLRLNLKEEWFWSRNQKSLWRYKIVHTILNLDNTLPIEEIHVHAGRHSPRNEFRCDDADDGYAFRCDDADDGYAIAPTMMYSLSGFPFLTVLRLSGQFCVGTNFFELILHESFPALTTFYLGIGPDTDYLSWFSVKDTTPHAWSAAARDPKWAESVALTAAGVLPQDPPFSPKDDNHGDGNEVLTREPAKRYRTLPDDLTLGCMLMNAGRAAQGMRRIETFSICLEDDFSGDDNPQPFTPPFLTRVFEMHFVVAPSGGGNATLTWKLGQKVDHWRPARQVLDEWKVAARKRAEVELDVSYVE